jgi:ABC-type Fe3+ transport system permease subunit
LNQKNAPPAKKPKDKPKRHIDCGRILYTAFLCMCMASVLCLPAFAAGTTIWTKASEVMKDVYTQVLGISTIAAVVTAAVALLLMNFSRSGRTVDESRAWLKRIIITWIILNSLGFIMSYVTPFFSGGQYTP